MPILPCIVFAFYFRCVYVVVACSAQMYDISRNVFHSMVKCLVLDCLALRVTLHQLRAKSESLTYQQPTMSTYIVQTYIRVCSERSIEQCILCVILYKNRSISSNNK